MNTKESGRPKFHNLRLFLLSASALLLLTPSCKEGNRQTTESEGESGQTTEIPEVVKPENALVERIDTCNLTILYPHFNKIDLACGEMPEEKDTTVIMCAAACYTGNCLDTFMHNNIAGDHVSGGIRYKGYRSKRNTGAFIYYGGKWDFVYNNYSRALDEAAKNGGMAFAQEMMIHNGKIMPTVRKDNNRNQFRSLCQIGDRLCIIESNEIVRFGDFKKALLQQGVTEALYTDMGPGWNHAWYRYRTDSVVELHPKVHDYCTNWITFYQ